MIAWITLVVFFALPTCDLTLRLIGVPTGFAWCADLALAALLIVPVLRKESPWPGDAPAGGLWSWRLVAMCLLIAGAWYWLRLSLFRFSPLGEGIYDLHYIASLSAAGHLPAPELWNPGAELTRYYYLGFYIIAFYARVLGLEPAHAYLMFLGLIPMLVFAITWSAMRGGTVIRTLAAFAATFPATGLSAALGLRLITVPEHLRPMAHVRLTEWADQAQPGSWVSGLMDGRAYPIEGLTHLLGWLGDLHPPVYTLLLLSVLIGLAYSDRRGFAGAGFAAVAGWAVPVSFFLNPWTMPCFATVALYSAVRDRRWRDPGIVICGALVGAVVMTPLWWHSDLATGAVSLAWLPSELRSSPIQFLTIWGPLLTASAVLIRGGGRWGFVAVFAAMILGLEWVLLDDPYGGTYERFNGVLKIGSFALAGWTMVVLAELGRSRSAAMYRVIATVLACIALAQLWDVLGARAGRTDAKHNWALNAALTVPADDRRLLFESLHGQCPGLTLERQTSQAYTLNPLVSTLLAWPTLSGWPSHLAQIGALSAAASARQRQAQAWFESADPRALGTAQPRYVLIDRSLNWDMAEIERRAAMLAPAYAFRRLDDAGGGPVVGYFVSTAACASRER